jgi:non-homologous end joining protein Ku
LNLVADYVIALRVPSSDELELGAGLIEKLSSENFEPEAYRDEYRNRVLAPDR